jgi:hypothetical protein
VAGGQVGPAAEGTAAGRPAAVVAYRGRAAGRCRARRGPVPCSTRGGSAAPRAGGAPPAGRWRARRGAAAIAGHWANHDGLGGLMR